jgi:hypothetical protein
MKKRCQLQGCTKSGLPTRLEIFIKGHRLVLCDACEKLCAERAVAKFVEQLQAEGKI